MLIDRQFREIVTDTLKARGWSQSEFARRLGITRAMVSQYLAPDGPSPGSEVVERWLAALELEPVLGTRPLRKPARELERIA